MTIWRLGSAAEAGTLQITTPTPTIPPHNTVATHPTMSFIKTQPAWLLLAIASGGCAAFNGVFAKLYCTPTHPSHVKPDTNNPRSTTTDLTTSWSSAIGSIFGLSPTNKLFEYLIRGVRPLSNLPLPNTQLTPTQLFFALNLVFNAIMWGLFTRALTLASSTVRVSIINTSANFMVTAVLGALIFSEKLPGVWWLGAAMLVAGSVIIGMRDETETEAKAVVTGSGEAPLLDGNGEPFRDEDGGEEGDEVELRGVDRREGESSDEDGVLK